MVLIRLPLKIQPRSHQNAVLGWHDEALKIALKAPPVDGQANEALIEFLAKLWGLRKAQIQLLQGATSRHKLIQIETDDEAGLRAKWPAIGRTETSG